MEVRWHVAVPVAAALALTSCVADPVQKAEQRPVTGLDSIFSTQDMLPLALARVVATIPRGTHIGSYSYGPGCDFGREETWQADYGDLGARGFNSRFFETLSGAGYRVVGDPNQLFDVAAERASARYLVGAQITELKMSLCNHINFWTAVPYGPRGDAYIKIRWQVYSAAERRVVYETVSDGNGNTAQGSRDGLIVLMQQAFAHAAANLAADSGFRGAVSGQAAPAQQAAAPATVASLELPTYARLQGPITGRTQSIAATGVTVLSGSGHGSGFFVSEDGLILTNQHVVGSAEQVNVRLGAGIEVVGRVLRRDAVRDVALVKIEIARARPLPISTTTPAVGSEVYAMGSPSDPNLAGTLTRGIVSALRIFPRSGVELPMIQSDAAIYGGNSGGPLMDASGNVVGIAVSTAADSGRSVPGVNFFIPIDDALRYLNIRLGQPRELRF